MIDPKKAKHPPKKDDKAPASRGSAIDSFKVMTTGVSGAEWLRRRRASR